MHIFCIDMEQAEVSTLPNLFTVCGYKIFFWPDDGSEPIHVHIAKGKPTPNATKIWLTRAGGCIVANNYGKIADNELNELTEFISAQFFLICNAWKEHFMLEEINFYC